MAVLFLGQLPTFGQTPMMMHPGRERILAVVPMQGTGAADDPKRPVLFSGNAIPKGVLSWRYLPSDDGQKAIVEIVVSDSSALAPFLAARGPDVKIFERGTDDRTSVETEIRRVRRDFKMEDLQPAMGRRP